MTWVNVNGLMAWREPQTVHQRHVRHAEPFLSVRLEPAEEPPAAAIDGGA